MIYLLPLILALKNSYLCKNSLTRSGELTTIFQNYPPDTLQLYILWSTLGVQDAPSYQ